MFDLQFFICQKSSLNSVLKFIFRKKSIETHLRIITYLEHIKITYKIIRKGCSSVLFALNLHKFYNFYPNYLCQNLQY